MHPMFNDVHAPIFFAAAHHNLKLEELISMAVAWSTCQLRFLLSLFGRTLSQYEERG